MARVLPERTVEAWTTAYLTRWFPTAHLWAPTQRDDYSWDLSGGLPNGLHFVFEYKAVEGYRGPYVPINLTQLDEYIEVNNRLRQTFAWYLLPMWPYLGPPGRVLPAEVVLRTLRAEDPRPQWRSGWALPQPPDPTPTVPPLRTEMTLGRGCESYFYVAEPERIKASGRVHHYGGRSVGIPVADVPEVAEGMTLEHFLMLLDRRAVGLGWNDLAGAIEDYAGELGAYPAFGRGAATFIAVTPGSPSPPD